MSSEGRFSAEFPAPTRENEFLAHSNYGSLSVQVVTADLGKASYSVIYTDYPKEAITTEAEVFDLALLDVAADLGGKVDRHFEEELQSFPGRGYVLNFGRDRVAVGRFYLAGRRLYRVQVTLPREQEDSAATKRFLKSFAIRSPS